MKSPASLRSDRVATFPGLGGRFHRNTQLESNQKIAFVLPEVFAEFGNQEKGFIRVRSSRGILGFELFGRQDLEFLSAVPQQTVTN